MKPWQTWHLSDLLRYTAFIMGIIALAVALLAPIEPETRTRLLIAIVSALAYALLMWTPWLSNKQTLVDAFPYSTVISNTLFLTLIVMAFYQDTQVIAALYVVSIVGSAIRRGMRIALWSALLSSLGFFIALGFLGALMDHIDDLAVFSGVFFVVGIFTGSISDLSWRRMKQFENVMANNRDAILILDTNGRFEYINPAGQKFSGFTAKEMVGRSFFDWVAPPDQANAHIVWDSMHAGTLPDSAVIVRVLTKTGESRILSASFAFMDENPRRYLVMARDITNRERERAAHARRDDELRAERKVATTINQSLDLHRVLELTLDQVLGVLGVDIGAIYLANDAQTELTLAVSRNLPDDFIKKVQHYTFGEGITGLAATQKEAIIVPNLDNEPRTCFKPQGSGISSQISMPLITHDRVVGVLNANRNSTQSFTEEDDALVHAMAASIAVAIDHARLFETLEQRVETRTAELGALNRIANVVNCSLDLDALLNATLEELTHTLQLTGAAIALYESDKSTLTLYAQKGFQESGGNESPWSHWNPKLNFDELPNDHTQAFDVEDLKLPLRDQWLSEGMRSFCHVPLSAAGNRIGILGLVSKQKGHFGEAEVRWLTAVGNTIAVAICNAQLYKATEHQVIQLATLRKIDRILYSTLDLAPMLQIVLTSIAQVVSHDFAIVYLLEGTKMRGVAANGINLSNLASYAFETTGDLAYEELIRERKPLVIDDLHPDTLHWSMIPNLDKVHSWMGTPLIARETVIGQISLYSATPNAFTSEHSEWMQSFSNHAAVAIANALLRAELSRQASCDSLTQVLNHGRFIEELRDACAHAQAHHEPISLIMLDLDNFKHYNDTYGHVVGDAVLRATVQAIRVHIHQSDLVGRWGGEEFGIALHHANSQRAMQIAERIRKTLVGTPIRDRHGTLIPPPTASQGIASLGETAIDVDDLIEDADRALYLAKNRGRDQVAIATKKK